MSNTPIKVAFVFLLILAVPSASFARGGGGGGRGGGFGRTAGQAAMGNVPISGIARGPGNAGGLNNTMVDPSGFGNGSRIAAPPPPSMAVPTVPQFK
jgi:hypothetical protein